MNDALLLVGSIPLEAARPRAPEETVSAIVSEHARAAALLQAAMGG